ncbi:hypothetical protein QTO34_003392 [Cnephaeus nilssonii]|uniref:Type 2 DNA topoisomerase 6 subunit B-like n=1 Tax=Cnephaeus nilssonii TaxID=3371016 RepID=A0AA40HRG5_CNENI|nr:hypothetical protein QTO34_003392 [Eptesicus nilssonii]
MQSILPGSSAKLNWTSEEVSYSQDISRVTPFQMTFEVDEKPRTLMTDSLVIKNFLRKIVMVHPKIRFNFSVKVNGILSTEIFEAENEPTLNLSNGIALVVNYQHYMSQEQSITAVFKDTSYFIDWNKYHLCMVPNLDLNLDRDMVLPDVSYQVESSEGDQSQNMDLQEQTLLLILFVDFHSQCPVQQMELWGIHTLLTAHLSTILQESHSVVQDSIQFAVDQALEQHHQVAKVHQKFQTSLSVAVNSIMSIVTGSTSCSFRKICLQALQAADTQEFGTKLHKSFYEVTQQRVLHHCSCEVKQQLHTEKNDTEESTEDAHENSSLELHAGTSGLVANKKLKKGSLHQVVEGTWAFHSARAPSPSEDPLRRGEPPAAYVTPSGSRAGPGNGPEDALWLQEVSNLSEWLSPSH